MKVIIDRFEGEFALVELPDRSMAELALKLLPTGCREGDVIEIRIDREATDERKREIAKLMDEVWE